MFGRSVHGEGGGRLEVVLIAAALVASCTGGAATPTPTPAPTSPPAPSASASPVIVESPSANPSTDPGTGLVLTWRVGEIPPMIGPGPAEPVAVAAGDGDGGFAAVGTRTFRDTDTPSGGMATAWRSGDGITWEPAIADQGLEVGDEIFIDDYPWPGLVDVTWGPAGFVAVGVALESSARFGGAWQSTDGRRWIRTELPDPSHARPAAVAWNGSAYAIVGVVNEPASPRAAVWLSADGRSWLRVTDGDAFDIGGYITYPAAIGSGGPADVTAAPDGSFLAVGKTCTATSSMDEQSECRPYAVRSADGRTWTRVPVPAEDAVLRSVAATGTRAVAVANGTPAGGLPVHAQVVVGHDAAWSLIQLPNVPPLGHVVVFRDGFLALSASDNAITLWASPDGETWTSVPGVPQPPDVTALHDVDLVVAGDRVLVVGSTEVSSAAGMVAFSILGS